MKIGLNDIEKIGVALCVMNMLDWGDLRKCIRFDSTDESIMVCEDKLMQMIQMVNPSQRVRKLRLVSRDEFGSK